MKDRFFSELQREFAPRLRALAFRGSGRQFARIDGETIQAITVQGSRHGDGCFLNLGLHFAFLPVSWKGHVVDPRDIKEVDCEFRARLSPSMGTDHMWKYGNDESDMKLQARSLMETHFKLGEAIFGRFSNSRSVTQSVTLAELRCGRPRGFPWHLPSPLGLALALARIHLHHGDKDEATAFAHVGLNELGDPRGLRRQFETIISA
jgi:Domain of unknown function (DUF4304)